MDVIIFGMTQIKQVRAFQTTDGKHHDKKSAALIAQFEIDMRAIFQTAIAGHPSNFTTVAAANIIRKQSGEFKDLITRYGISIARAERDEAGSLTSAKA